GEIHFAAADGARCVAARVQARRAQPVDGDAGHRVRQPGQEQRHARDIAVVLAGLVGAAEIDVIEPRPIGLAVAGDQRLDRHRGEIVGAYLGERAAVAADRRARPLADEDLPHRSLRFPAGIVWTAVLAGYLPATAARVKRPRGPDAGPAPKRQSK